MSRNHLTINWMSKNHRSFDSCAGTVSATGGGGGETPSPHWGGSMLYLNHGNVTRNVSRRKSFINQVILTISPPSVICTRSHGKPRPSQHIIEIKLKMFKIMIFLRTPRIMQNRSKLLFLAYWKHQENALFHFDCYLLRKKCINQKSSVFCISS